MGQTMRNSKILRATAEAIYNAFCNPKALESWLAPGIMTAKVHAFDFEVGVGYEMSLFYSPDEKELRGKPREKKTD